MPDIAVHLWFDKEAGAAADFYTGLFPGSEIRSRTVIPGTPSGDTELVSLRLAGRSFQFISAGPLFKITPAVSFLVYCPTAAEVDRLWAGLSPGGLAMMELGSYPFSPRYGWIQDRFGVSWQVMLPGAFPPAGAAPAAAASPATAASPAAVSIAPTLMYTGAVAGRAEEAIEFYSGLFPDSGVDLVSRYGQDAEPNRPDFVNHAAFRLAGQRFAAMDSAYDHGFGFTEATSLMVECADQAEVDRYWSSLSADPAAEACGWLKDRYGLSWQIVPRRLGELMSAADAAGSARITAAFLKMKKFDIAALEAAARAP
jgi:predicted 3-demethylubiquinone-9 3-methyltransferase (glyoxalase superfamily)